MLGALFLILLARYLTPLNTKWVCFSALQKFEVNFCLNHSPSIFFYNYILILEAWKIFAKKILSETSRWVGVPGCFAMRFPCKTETGVYKWLSFMGGQVTITRYNNSFIAHARIYDLKTDNRTTVVIFIYLYIYSFIHSFIHSLIHSFIHSFIHHSFITTLLRRRNKF